MTRYETRRQAYEFIQHSLGQLPVYSYNSKQAPCILLDDLVRLKQGLIDPPPALVSSLKELFGDSFIQGEIDRYLVEPFQEIQWSEDKNEDL